MSTNEWEYDDDEFDQEEQPTGPKALREQLKREKAERKRLQETLQQVQRDLRQRTVKETLASKGVNPKIAAFVPTDVEGEEAIVKWLSDYADVFGVAPAAESVEIDAGEVLDAQRASQAASGQAPQPTTDQMAAIRAATSDEELQAAMRLAGLA